METYGNLRRPGLHLIVKFQPLPVLLRHFAIERQRGEPRIETIAAHELFATVNRMVGQGPKN